jgi:cellulose biosynthesis protein BcsQ
MIPGNIDDYRKRIIVIYSPDGGNGKSEIAANLAFCFAARGLRTWVLDANLFAPTQDIIFTCPLSPDVTFSEYLLDPAVKEIPVYNISGRINCDNYGQIFLTPSRSGNPDARFALKEKINSGIDIYNDIPDALFRAMQSNEIDLLIVDTHPSFEEINEVWLALTEYLIIVSRMNDLDIENLKLLLRDGEVADIARKLIVFNNVQLDENRQALQAMENAMVAERFFDVGRCNELERELSQSQASADNPGGAVTIYDEPFLYSEKLARFGDGIRRDGLFVQKEPEDLFSGCIERLSGFVLSAWKK